MTEIKIKPFYIISFSFVVLYKYILKFPIFIWDLNNRDWLGTSGFILKYTIIGYSTPTSTAP